MLNPKSRIQKLRIQKFQNVKKWGKKSYLKREF